MRKLKNKDVKKSRASVCIFLSFLMLPIYSFAAVIVDAARVSSARQMVSCSADMTLNSGLAGYNDVLKTVYGLFAMSSTEEELQQNLSGYFYRTIENTALSEADEKGKKYIDSIGSIFSDPSNADFDNLVRLTTDSFKASYIDGAVLSNPDVMKNQIVEYMKYIGPVRAGKGFITKLGVFKDFEKQSEAVEAKIEHNKSLGKITELCSKIYSGSFSYNKFIEETMPYGHDSVRSVIEESKGIYKEALQYVIMLNSSSVTTEQGILYETENQDKEAEKIKKILRENADILFGSAADTLCSFTEKAYAALEHTENTERSIQSLLDVIDEYEKKDNDLKSNVNLLSDGELKTAMQNEYEALMASLDKNDIEEYRIITHKNAEALRKVISCVSSVTFYNKRVCDYFDYVSEYSYIIPEYSIIVSGDEHTLAEELLNEHFAVPVADIGDECIHQGSEYDFYRYLSKMCSSNYNPEVDEKTAKDFFKKVLSLGIPEELQIPESASSSLLTVVSEDKLKTIKSSAEKSFEAEPFTINSTASKPDEILKNQQSFLRSSTEFLEDIEELAESVTKQGMENLFLTEYITEMFSCYTSDKQCDNGEVSDTISGTLSGITLNSENNVFYRAEAEYILWGNEDMKKNLLNTQALMFGTRFALNNIYAFTDSEIRIMTDTAAAAIAGWTGFGVPVVKTVLTMALALAESVTDMKELLSGGAVPVYKSDTSWRMKPSADLNSFMNNADKLSSDKKTETVKSGSVTLTYKEYLKIFIMLSFLSENNKNAMLTRTAIIIDTNITKGMKNALVGDRIIRPDESFNISKAYTMLGVDADVYINTWFLGAFVPVSRTDTEQNQSAGFSGDHEKKKKISYVNIQSY